MIDQKNLSEFSTGEDFSLFLIVTKCEIKTAKNGRSYLNLELRDKSILLPAKMWDRFEDIADKIKEGIIVKVNGQIEEFNNAPQIKINKIRTTTDQDNVSAEDFLPKSTRSLTEMIDEFNHTLGSINNPYIKELLHKIFSGSNFEKFVRSPAGKSWHHSYLHGLLEHTLEIVKICDLMCTFHPDINRDLLICGALLHDFGKTEELTFDTVFDYSDRGRLIGHIMIGTLVAEKNIDTIPGFPNILKDQLLHLILSHQGKLEFASPVEPKTLEAIVLYQADELSAKTNAYKYAIESDKNKGNNWTRFLPLANTSLYIPPDSSNE